MLGSAGSARFFQGTMFQIKAVGLGVNKGWERMRELGVSIGRRVSRWRQRQFRNIVRRRAASHLRQTPGNYSLLILNCTHLTFKALLMYSIKGLIL